MDTTPPKYPILYYIRRRYCFSSPGDFAFRCLIGLRGFTCCAKTLATAPNVRPQVAATTGSSEGEWGITTTERTSRRRGTPRHTPRRSSHSEKRCVPRNRPRSASLLQGGCEKFRKLLFPAWSAFVQVQALTRREEPEIALHACPPQCLGQIGEASNPLRASEHKELVPLRHLVFCKKNAVFFLAGIGA
jgi:hypothetical protein